MSIDREYKTREPIADELLALHLLAGTYGDRTERYLVYRNPHRPDQKPEIRVDIYNGGYGHDLYNETDYYALDHELAERLASCGFLDHLPRVERTRGSLDYGDEAFTYGTRAWDYRRAREAAVINDAKLLVKPGTHTKWSGTLLDPKVCWDPSHEVEYLESESDAKRDHRPRRSRVYWSYRGSVLMRTPLNERLRVWMDTNEVEQLPSKDAA